MLKNSSMGTSSLSPYLQDVLIILGYTWKRKYNCFLDWNCKLAHCQSANNQLWMPLQQLDASYASFIMAIPKQLNSNETPKWLPETQIKQGNTHIWLKINDNSTTTNKPIKATRKAKPEVWKWISKQNHEEVSIPT